MAGRDGSCPCGRIGTFGAVPYQGCCGRYLEEASPQYLDAPDPQTLMRSRYTAYALGRTEYLLATWHPSTRPQTVDDDPAVTWLGLQVHDRHADNSVRPEHRDRAERSGRAEHRDRAQDPGHGGHPRDGDTGVVEFTARWRAGGREQTMRERSRFVRADGRWFYLGT